MIRQFELLKTIVEAYIDRAEPIGSHLIVEEYHFPVSSATVRNSMAELEGEGYIEQPHTSAGRVPTEKGYRWYIDHAMEAHSIGEELRAIQEAVNASLRDRLSNFGRVAQCIVEMTGEAVVVSQPPDVIFTRGLSHLFSQPEFSEIEMVRDLTQSIDRVEQWMSFLEENMSTPTVNLVMGKDNPLGKQLSTLFLNIPTHPPTVIGLIGPMRMPYARNFAILQALHDSIEPLL